jgi:hypothetical protein
MEEENLVFLAAWMILASDSLLAQVCLRNLSRFRKAVSSEMSLRDLKGAFRVPVEEFLSLYPSARHELVCQRLEALGVAEPQRVAAEHTVAVTTVAKIFDYVKIASLSHEPAPCLELEISKGGRVGAYL